MRRRRNRICIRASAAIDQDVAVTDAGREHHAAGCLGSGRFPMLDEGGDKSSRFRIGDRPGGVIDHECIVARVVRTGGRSAGRDKVQAEDPVLWARLQAERCGLERRSSGVVPCGVVAQKRHRADVGACFEAGRRGLRDADSASGCQGIEIRLARVLEGGLPAKRFDWQVRAAIGDDDEVLQAEGGYEVSDRPPGAIQPGGPGTLGCPLEARP